MVVFGISVGLNAVFPSVPDKFLNLKGCFKKPIDLIGNIEYFDSLGQKRHVELFDLLRVNKFIYNNSKTGLN